MIKVNLDGWIQGEGCECVPSPFFDESGPQKAVLCFSRGQQFVLRIVYMGDIAGMVGGVYDRAFRDEPGL